MLRLSDGFGKGNGGDAALKFLSVFGKAGLVSFLVLIFVSFSFAQIPKLNLVNEIDKIPVNTKNEFAANYSEVQNVIWKKEDGYYKASFTKDNKPLMAFFNYDDQLIGEGYYVEYTDLPEKARERIAEKYPNYSPQKSMFFNNNESNVSDFLNFPGSTLPEESYFVLLKEDAKEIVVNVTKDGEVAYYIRTNSR